MLIVTARNPLQVSYGSVGYERIRAALDTWAAVDGDRVLAIDDPGDMQSMGLEAGTSDPADIQRAIQEAAERYPSTVQSVLLAGGGAILPFFSIPNPVQDRSTDQDIN